MKYFYVANNFRNEKTDATHLAEFFQAEGFIIGDDLTLADLILISPIVSGELMFGFRNGSRFDQNMLELNGQNHILQQEKGF